MTGVEFVDEVVALAERAIAQPHGEGILAARPYLDGGLIPLGQALDDRPTDGQAFDELFVDCLKLLVDGIEPESVWMIYDVAARAKLQTVERRLSIERMALQLLVQGGHSPRTLRSLLGRALIGSMLVTEPVEPPAEMLGTDL